MKFEVLIITKKRQNCKDSQKRTEQNIENARLAIVQINK